MSVNAQRYIKNNTDSTVYYLGTPIVAGAFYEIPPSKYIAYANLESLLTDIAAGDASVSRDGVTVLTGLNDQINALKGFENNPDAGDIVAAPVLSKKIRVETGGNIDLNSSSSSYTTIYSYSGSGKLGGFILDFDSDRIQCKLTIDGETVFDVDCEWLDNMFDNDKYSYFSSFTWLSWDNSKNKLLFTPEHLIEYSSSISIEAKCNYDSSGRDCDRYIINLTKET